MTGPDHDEEMLDMLGALTAPPHRPGFWTDLDAELAEVEPELPTAGTVAGLDEQADPTHGTTVLDISAGPWSRRPNPRHWLALAAAVLLVVAIGTALVTRDDGDDGVTSVGSDGSEPVDTTATTAAASTTEPTATTATTTEVADTTATTEAAAATATTAAATGVERLLVFALDGVSWLDVGTGEVARVNDEAFDALYPYGVELTADGSAAYYGVGEEDNWYMCETVLGSVDRLDLATGETTRLGPGLEPALSPDGTRLAFFTSGSCRPDPDTEFPGAVVADADRITVLDLASGTEVAVLDLTRGAATDAWALVWADDSTLLYYDGTMHSATLDGVITDLPAAGDEPFGPYEAGAHLLAAGDGTVTGAHVANGQTIVRTVDLATGVEVDSTSTPGFYTVSRTRSGELVYESHDGETVLVDGAEVDLTALSDWPVKAVGG